VLLVLPAAMARPQHANPIVGKLTQIRKLKKYPPGAMQFSFQLEAGQTCTALSLLFKTLTLHRVKHGKQVADTPVSLSCN